MGRIADSRWNDYHSMIGIPLKSGAEVWGVIGASYLNEEEKFGKDEVDVLQRFAELASIAYDNAQLYRKLEVELAERRRTEEALRESEARWQFAIEGAGDGLWDWNVQSNEVFFSRQWKAMLGYEAQELENTIEEWDKRIHPDDRNQVYVDIRKHRDGLNPVYVNEHRLRCKDGTYKWVLDRGKVISWTKEGLPLRMVGTHTDISERKRAEEEREEMESHLRQAHKMEAVGTLAGGIAHEFNNILGIILGNTELAFLDVPEWSPTREYLDAVRTASLRARDVVQQLLSFSRKREAERKIVDTGLLTKESLKLLRASIPAHIEIREFIPQRLFPITADATQIHQVLINLCTNASHAMEERGGVIEIRLENIRLDERGVRQSSNLKPGSYVHLAVSDTGYGIPLELIHRIFDPYFTTKEVGKGSGMGLAVVHGIVKNHSGEISVESRVGEGTTFHVYLPAHEEEVGIEPVGSEALAASGKERILFVDDEGAMASLGKEMLSHLGYTATAVTKSTQALELFGAAPDQYDLIITDLAMPEMTGDVLARKAMELRADIPVILCTGFSEWMDEHRAAEIGIRAFLSKPMTIKDLSRVVRAVLDGGEV